MKKLLLAALLGLFSFAASANNKIDITNLMAACPGANITVQWVCYDFSTCAVTLTSPVYSAVTGTVYDLDDPTTWGGIKPPSYSLYAAIVCIDCPPVFCLPTIFTLPGICGPTSAGPLMTPCCGSFGADITSGGGGICFHLTIHP